ncbi:MAG TPA: hypothetical protein EYP39_00620 [Ghiorsea sp.]|nr:hypothetical protein [Ghiorsea sp.]
MKKKLILASVMIVFGLSATYPTFALVSKAGAAEDVNMAQVQLILKKLRSSMANMKDFDELEEAGMEKSDVDRLRNAMKGKIKQMTSDAVDLIRVL